MEGNDYLSATGSGTGGAAPAPVLTSGMGGANLMSGNLLGSGLRPTTAAAVASSGGGANMDADMMGGAPDELDVDYEMHQTGGKDRPNTAGAMLPGGYSRGASSGAQGAQASWGYSRQPVGGDPSTGAGGMMKGGASGPLLGSANPGIGEYNADGQPAVGQRRPHTAHGGRAGFPSSSPQMAGAAYGSDQLKPGMYDGEQVSFDVVFYTLLLAIYILVSRKLKNCTYVTAQLDKFYFIFENYSSFFRTATRTWWLGRER